MIARIGTTLALALALAAPLAGQRATGEQEVRVTLRGVVVDALHGDPLPNAMLRLVEDNRGVLTDSLGRFTFPSIEPGPKTLAAKQYGYEEVVLDIEVTADVGAITIALDPGPYALEGFNVIADRLATMNQRLKSRRNATATTVRAMDQARLARSAARDLNEFLDQEAFLMRVPCPALSMALSCIIRRGAARAPRVYIDEAPVIGGLDQLAMYKPYELYLLEVYAGGSEIRAYTHQFMDRMARRPQALIPIGL